MERSGRPFRPHDVIHAVNLGAIVPYLTGVESPSSCRRRELPEGLSVTRRHAPQT
jgi:hypothetical protein